jgi:hypothetical protein
MTAEYYIYACFRPHDGQIFYVGKGRGSRAERTTKSRNRYFKNTIVKYGPPIVVIIRSDLTEDEAFEVEKALIKAIGRYPTGPLVNMTDGGTVRAAGLRRPSSGLETAPPRRSPRTVPRLRPRLALTTDPAALWFGPR